MWTRSELKQKAKRNLSLNYWKTILVCLIMAIIMGETSSCDGVTTIRTDWDNLTAAVNSDSYRDFKSGINEIEDTLGEIEDSLNNLIDHDYHDANIVIDGKPVVEIHTDGLSEAEKDELIENIESFGNLMEDTINEGIDKFQDIPNYVIVIALSILFLIIIIISIIGTAFSMGIKAFICNPFEVGCKNYLITNDRPDNSLKKIFVSFKENYINAVFSLFIRDLYVFLWCLLFIIPGIVKSYEYRMVPYILAENPNMKRYEAFELSKKMMKGQKWNAFVLDLSFIGWFILSGLTLGLLGLLYVKPYKYQTDAELYKALKDTDSRVPEQQDIVTADYVEVN